MPLKAPSHGIQREFIRIQAILAGTNRSRCVHPGRGNESSNRADRPSTFFFMLAPSVRYGRNPRLPPLANHLHGSTPRELGSSICS
jgi:hypothetical protein